MEKEEKKEKKTIIRLTWGAIVRWSSRQDHSVILTHVQTTWQNFNFYPYQLDNQFSPSLHSPPFVRVTSTTKLQPNTRENASGPILTRNHVSSQHLLQLTILCTRFFRLTWQNSSWQEKEMSLNKKEMVSGRPVNQYISWWDSHSSEYIYIQCLSLFHLLFCSTLFCFFVRNTRDIHSFPRLKEPLTQSQHTLIRSPDSKSNFYPTNQFQDRFHPNITCWLSLLSSTLILLPKAFSFLSLSTSSFHICLWRVNKGKEDKVKGDLRRFKGNCFSGNLFPSPKFIKQ